MKVYRYVLLQERLDQEPLILLTPPTHDDDEPWPQRPLPRFPLSTHHPPAPRAEDVGAEDGGAGAEDGAAAAVGAEDGEVEVEAEVVEVEVVEVVEAEVEEPHLLPEPVISVCPTIVC